MVCLDTSFIIDILKGDPLAEKKEEEIDSSAEEVFIAAPSIMELSKGAYLCRRPDTEKEKIIEFLSLLKTLSLDKKSAFKSGEVEATLMKKGSLIEIEDIMIGAIALTNKQKIITKNGQHFRKIQGLSVETY